MRSRVEDLFERKSAPWGGKYLPGQPLHYRLALFASAVERLRATPTTLLDFGCGAGNLAAHLSQRGWCVSACDISQGMLDQASCAFTSAPISWKKIDAEWEALPYSACAFDIVVSSSVLEYVPDVRHVFNEVCRILKSKGGFIATVPNVTHRIRRFEAVLQMLLPPVTLRFDIPYVPQGLKRVAERANNYTRFLETSRNRYPLSHWQRLAWEAGLDLEFTEGIDDPLLLLAFSKRT